MPQIKKSFSLSSSILPKIELGLENVFTRYSTGSKDSATYLPIYSDLKSSHILTSEAESDGADSLPSRPRKRQRLDHLSQEEKIMRRKMKNRVAAQTARDRKKARMAELEEQVLELETERKMLLLANMELQNKNSALQKENEELKRRLGEPSVNEKVEKSSAKIKEELTSDSESDIDSRLSDTSRSLEHASFINVPLQQGQDLQVLTLWMMQYIYLPVVVRLMLFLTYCSGVVKTSYNARTSLPLCQIMEKPESVKHDVLQWWGPHQKAWNPSKD